MAGHEERSEAEASERYRRVRGYFVAWLLMAALVGAIVIVLASGREGEESAGSFDDRFAADYEGLADRRTEAGVPTMSEGGGSHFHAQLAVYTNGKQIEVPANIGIDPAEPPELMAGLHTHDPSGTIHNEAGSNSTLGQFFAIWGVPFSRSRLGPYEAGGSKQVRMWVNGEPSEEFGDLALEDGQEIVVAYGREDEDRSGLTP